MRDQNLSSTVQVILAVLGILAVPGCSSKSTNGANSVPETSDAPVAGTDPAPSNPLPSIAVAPAPTPTIPELHEPAPLPLIKHAARTKRKRKSKEIANAARHRSTPNLGSPSGTGLGRMGKNPGDVFAARTDPGRPARSTASEPPRPPANRPVAAPQNQEPSTAGDPAASEDNSTIALLMQNRLYLGAAGLVAILASFLFSRRRKAT